MQYRRLQIDVFAKVWDGNADTANGFIGDSYGTDWEFKEPHCLDILVGKTLLVRTGSWILKHRDGSFSTMSDEDFRQQFVHLP